MSSVVTTLDVSRKTLIVIAAVVSSFFAPAMRCSGFVPGASPAPRICGMTVTPVSKPDNPSASCGNTTRARARTPIGLPPPCRSMADVQSPSTAGCAATRRKESTMTTAFSVRKTATSTTAMPIASWNPRRNTAPSRTISRSVIGRFALCRACGMSGFSTACAAASAADRVIVMMNAVPAKPSSTRTNSLPAHQGSSRSSIAIEPSPRKLSDATRRYTGSAPKSVRSTSTSVATGEMNPAAIAAMAGW